MVLYFTGTGNSKFVAMALAEALQDAVMSMNSVMREGNTLSVYSEKPYVIVAPIHASRYPDAVIKMLESATMDGSKDVYCVGTMGQSSGGAYKALEKLFGKMGMNFKGYCGVVMPNNYVVGMDADTPEEVREKMTAAVPAAKEMAKQIKVGENIGKNDTGFVMCAVSDLLNYCYRKFMLKKQTFHVSESCIGCGVCAASCPTANIFVYDGKANFGENCTGCLSCLNRCPMQAIDIKGKTEGRGRYVCVEYKDRK